MIYPLRRAYYLTHCCKYNMLYKDNKDDLNALYGLL
jgi:hypothetical protein